MASTPDYQSDALARIVAVTGAIAPDIDLTLGSVLQQWSVGVASSHADVKSTQDFLIQQASLATATGKVLENLALDVNTVKGVATPAIQSVLFTVGAGAPGGQITINQGFTVSTVGSQSGGPLLFDLIAPLTIPSPGSAVGLCQAEVNGSQGNVVAGAITQSNEFAFLVSVYNQSIATRGADAETDTSLRGRAFGNRTVQGSKAAIEQTAKAAGAIIAFLSDPHDGSAHTTLYAALLDGTLPTALQTVIQAAVNDVLPPTETSTVTTFAIVYAALAVTIAVPTGYDSGLTTSAVQAASIVFANTLGPGQTIQPLPWSNSVSSQVPALQAAGGDFYPTSAIPVLTTAQLFRFLAAPSAPTLVQQTGGSITLLSTVFVIVTWNTATGTSLGSVEKSILLTGANNEVVVTVPPAPSAAVTTATVYASLSTGTEKVQGTIPVTTIAGGSLTLATITTTGAVVPTTGTLSMPSVTVAAV